MATFKKLKSGNTQAQVYLGRPDQKFTTKTFPTETQAKRWARQVEAARDRGRPDRPDADRRCLLRRD